MAQANTKPQMVSFEKNGIRHVREVKPGEDAQEVLARPTEADLKAKRIKEETEAVDRIPGSAAVMAYAQGMKWELKSQGIRFPLAVYEYTKKKMEGEAQPFKHALRTLKEEEGSGRPDPKKVKTLNVCPKCKGRFKRVDIHVKHCTATTEWPPVLA